MTGPERVEIPVAACKSCGAEIIWAHTIKKDGSPGKMPFDKEPNNEKGVYCLVRKANGEIHATYIKKGQEFPLGGLPRTSHFSTCPQAGEWRKPKARPESNAANDVDDEIPF